VKQSPSREPDCRSGSPIPHLSWNRRFITIFTGSRHWTPSWARRIQSTLSHPVSPRSTLISSRLRLGLQSGLVPSGFPTKILYAFLVCSVRATCPTHLILFIKYYYRDQIKENKMDGICSVHGRDEACTQTFFKSENTNEETTWGTWA